MFITTKQAEVESMEAFSRELFVMPPALAGPPA